MLFFPGLDDVHHARHFDRAFISINRLVKRRSDFPVNSWIMDSGAFTALLIHGRHVLSVEEYAAQIARWRMCGYLMAAVTQDYMCEPFMLAKLGSTVEEHQAMTIERYIRLHEMSPGTYIMPVLQGFNPPEYVEHIRQYQKRGRLGYGTWIGVGSVCKRNSSVESVEDVLLAIKRERPDLRLHGFGLKTTALASPTVHDLLYSADSMAWSFAARKQGRDAHDWKEAESFAKRINGFGLDHAVNPERQQAFDFR